MNNIEGMAYNKVFITKERYHFFLQSGVNYEGFVIGMGYAYTFAVTQDSLFMKTVSNPRHEYDLSHHEIWNTPRMDKSPEAKARSFNFSLSEVEQIIQKRTVSELRRVSNLNISHLEEKILLTQKEAVKAIDIMEQNNKLSISLCITDSEKKVSISLVKIFLSDLLPYLHRQAIEDGIITASNKPIVFVQRLAETSNATVSFFMAYGVDNEIVSGYFLEPGGPPTARRNQDKRIPAGVYSINNYSSKNYPDNFIISNDIVPQSRRILIHLGNTHKNTEGCFLPGESYVLSNGDYAIKGGTSRNKLNQLRTILGKGDAIMIIKEIP